MSDRFFQIMGQSAILSRFVSKQPLSILNVFKTLIYQSLPFAIRPSRVFFSPITYTVYLNNYCNYKCEFCYLTKRVVSPQTLSLEDFEAIVRHPLNHHAFRVTLGGGEPFLHPELHYFANILKSQGKYVSVYTNGSFLERDLSKLINGGIDCINISHYDETFGNIKNVLNLMGRKSGFPAIRMSKIVTAEDYERMEEIINVAITHQIRNVIFKNYYPFDGENTDLVLKNKSAASREISRLKHKYCSAPIEITWPNLLEESCSFDCRNPSLNIIYGANGSIAPCCFIVPPQLYYGNLTSDDPWNSEPVRQLRLGKEPACTYCYFRHGLQNRLA